MLEDTSRLSAIVRRTRSVSVRIVHDDADGFYLKSPDDDVVGWVRHGIVGVTGFDDRASAIDGACAASRVLEAWLARQRLPPLSATGEVPTRVMGDGKYAFELSMSASMSDGMAIHAALIALRAAQGQIDTAHITWPSRRNPRGNAAGAPLPTTELRMND